MSTLAMLMDDNWSISAQPCNSSQFLLSSELPPVVNTTELLSELNDFKVFGNPMFIENKFGNMYIKT